MSKSPKAPSSAACVAPCRAWSGRAPAAVSENPPPSYPAHRRFHRALKRGSQNARKMNTPEGRAARPAAAQNRPEDNAGGHRRTHSSILQLRRWPLEKGDWPLRNLTLSRRNLLTCQDNFFLAATFYLSEHRLCSLHLGSFGSPFLRVKTDFLCGLRGPPSRTLRLSFHHICTGSRSYHLNL